MSLRKWIFADLYRRAPGPDALPWHTDEPPALLERAIAARGQPGRALDLGCGAGVHSVHLAKRGYSVVGIDFVPAAIELARARAQAAQVSVEWICGDVLSHEPSDAYDLVLDSGCLHHIPLAKLASYRALLDRWLAPSGDYLLVHFGKQHALDWRPIGPRRRSREAIAAFLQPYRLEDYQETFFDLPNPIGRSLAGVYWFRRSNEI
jgi:SAM-dependent methyltransferase